MDAMALSLLIKAQGAEQAKRTLGEIDVIGKNIAKNYTSSFAIVGAAAEKASARVSQTFDRSSSSVTTSFARIGSKATGVAAGIAAMGDVGASSLQKIVTASSSVAFGFGPQGAIVAGAGVAALAIVGIFTRARDEMRRTVEEARAWLESLDQGTALVTAKSLNELQRGRRFAKDPFDRLGIRGLESQKRQLEAAIARAAPEMSVRSTAGGDVVTMAESKETRDLRVELEKVTTALAEKNQRMAEGLEILKRQGGEEGKITIANATREASERAATEAARGAEQVRDRERKLMEDLVFAFSSAEYHLRGLNAAELVSLDIAKKKAEEERRRRAEFAASLGPNAPGGYLNPTEATGNMKLPAGGLSVDAKDKWLAAADEQFHNMGEQVGLTFGDAISAGFTNAFSGGGLAGGFAAMGKTILSGLGSIFSQMGKSLLQYGLVMKGLLPSLSNPFTSGFAAIAAGVALMALGGALGGMARGGGGGGGGSYGGGYSGMSTRGQDDYTKIVLMPSASTNSSQISTKPAVVFNATIIGQNDPAAQRQITELVERGLARSGRKLS